MNVIDSLFLALKNIGITDVPVDILNISGNLEQAGKLLKKIISGEIKNISSLTDYIKENVNTAIQPVKVEDNENNFIDVDESELKMISIEEMEQLFKSDRISFAETTDDNSVHGIQPDVDLQGNKEKSEDSDEIVNKADNNKDKHQDITNKTASLWSYKPIPDNEPEPYDEYITKSSVADNIEITGARVRGKKHKHDGTNCDDWFEFDTVKGWTIIAVSDGAGSKKFSRIGAMESCKAAIEFLKEKLNDENINEDLISKLSLPLTDSSFMDGCGFFAALIQEAVAKAYEAVVNAFQDRKSKYDYLKIIDRDMEFKDFSGTLLLCMIMPVKVNNVNEHFVISCQIGDGMICSVNRNSEFENALRLLGQPDSGAYSGETDFLTSESARRKESLMNKTKIMRSEITNIMLMTDGVADDYYPNAPQMLRLMLDLELNGILKISEKEFSENNKIPDKIPAPVCYPWVNDNEKMIAVQYANRIADSTGLTLKQLWENKALIKKASVESFNNDLPESKEQRLLRWLDNYVERGSFDDRTLLVLELGNQ